MNLRTALWFMEPQDMGAHCRSPHSAISVLHAAEAWKEWPPPVPYLPLLREKSKECWDWWHMLVIPHGRQRQEDYLMLRA